MSNFEKLEAWGSCPDDRAGAAILAALGENGIDICMAIRPDDTRETAIEKITEYMQVVQGFRMQCKASIEKHGKRDVMVECIAIYDGAINKANEILAWLDQNNPMPN
jgi:hypothetical protein